MKRPRITIAHIILVVLVIAIGLAAIRSGSAAWAGAMFSITFFAMISSLLGAALGRGMRRIYWSGFGVLGWSYLLLIYVPWLDRMVGRFLLAPNLFAYLEEVLHSDSQGGGGLQSLPLGILAATVTGGGFGGGPSGWAGVENLSDFVRIGLAMEALLWAFLGGWAACYFASGRDEGSNHHAAGTAGAPEAEGEGHANEATSRGR
ncbi:MAG: hypothetical protein ACLQIB_58570 [Isosphaeraceae bacterium]